MWLISSAITNYNYAYTSNKFILKQGLGFTCILRNTNLPCVGKRAIRVLHAYLFYSYNYNSKMGIESVYIT